MLEEVGIYEVEDERRRRGGSGWGRMWYCAVILRNKEGLVYMWCPKTRLPLGETTTRECGLRGGHDESMQGMPVPTSIPPGIHICTWFYYLLFLHFYISGLCGLCPCYNALPKWYPYSYDFITVSSQRKRRGVKMEHPGYFCPHTISVRMPCISCVNIPSRSPVEIYHQLNNV